MSILPVTRAAVLSPFALIALAASTASAQVPAKEWTNYYTGPAGFFNVGAAVTTDSSGNVYTGGESATGTGSRPVVVKYDAAGTQLWATRLGESDNDTGKVFVLDTAPDGGIIVGGFRVGPNADGSFTFGDYLITRLNPETGATEWTTYINGEGNNYDGLRALTLDAAGNIYATGESYSGVDLDILTVKLTPSGSEIWRVSKNGPAGGPDGIADSGAAIAVDPAGNVFVTGHVQTDYDSNEETNIYTPITIKYSPEGVELWSALMSTPGQGITIQLVPASDNTFDAVSTANNGLTQTVRYSSTGEEVWSLTYGGPASNGATAYASAVLPTGDIVIGGGVCQGSGFLCAEGAGIWVIDASAGAATLEYAFADPDPSTAGASLRGLAVDPTTGVIYGGGFTIFFNALPERQRALVFAYDPNNGIDLWADSFAPAGTYLADVAALAVSAGGPHAGGVVAVGTRSTAPGASSFLTVQYAGQSAPACPADFNTDGILNSDDLSDFITGYFNDPADPRCDFNADGVINADDLGDYITAYFNGCP